MMANFDKRTPIEKVFDQALIYFRQGLAGFSLVEADGTAGSMRTVKMAVPVREETRIVADLIAEAVHEAVLEYGATLEKPVPAYLRELEIKLLSQPYLQRFLNERPEVSR